MSSAALQTAPHQSPALTSPTLPSSAGGHPYSSSHSTSSREAYQSSQHASQPPSSSRRPSSRKASGSAAPPFPDSSSSMTDQAATAAAHYTDSRSYASERNMPPVAPPRTSSNQQSGSARKAAYANDKASNSPRRGQPEASGRSSRGDINGNSENHRSRRSGNPQSQDSPARHTNGRDERVAELSMPIRTHEPSTPKSSRDHADHIASHASGVDNNSRPVLAEYQGSPRPDDDAAPPPIATSSDDRRAGRSRQDHSRSHKGTSKFGDFILGNTIGEGEFGKVKLGWKQDSSVQVAIKLIKRDSVGSNPSRLAKIRREVTILRGLQHPNIVRLIDMVETERYIGIILEYASGGELFDYILNHRYLKDQSARRLFSQLISGVGYLHKKGIVHRDLKLENLLLDRNRNIIITDFGFANTFDPHEELAEEEELNLTDRDFVKRMGLDKLKSDGTRKGDLMQTSCGSPCYAAPELVVSDSLYTGRKVDVWSCGVILYAMLAGYLPFDDDPANPEGDNINLLYKYIVSTPLTFPEYVTPHARDLLRRILVPNPRKRADLFEVARHSWLSEYAHLVEFITSSTTTPSEAQGATQTSQEYAEAPMVARSSSVRESGKQKTSHAATVGGLAKTHGKIDPAAEQAQRTPKDAKRRTVQVEYVAPTTQTQRGGDAGVQKPRGRSSSRGPVEEARTSTSKDKPLPQDPPVSRDPYSKPNQSIRPPSSHKAVPPRTSQGRAVSDNPYVTNAAAAARPRTSATLQNTSSAGLQSRGSYGQPAPPAVADTNAQGRIQQPLNNEDEAVGRPSVSVPPKFAQMAGFHNNDPPPHETKGHRRSNTIGEISSKLLGRNGSVFGGRNKNKAEQQEKSRKYPPVSMANAMIPGEETGPRPSMDSKFSRRSFSLGLGKKRSGSISGSQGSGDKPDRRRFSLLPASFSLKSIGLGKEQTGTPPSEVGSQQTLPIQDPRTGQIRSITSHGEARGSTPFFDGVEERAQQHSQPLPPQQHDSTGNSSPVYHQRYGSAQLDNRRPNALPPYMQSGAHLNTGSDSSVDMRRPPTEPRLGQYQHGMSESEGSYGRGISSSRGERSRGVLQKNHKRFTDAYDQDDYRGHEGSSGAAKRVMDFFRRRGKARGGEDR
ncbi:Serine/threonine-protein kinase KIN4 [Paramyrothecium foliicola]|nr:Serine/threonine-protein kinase KIN4 [Paramyrothecium foliicola]